MGALAAPHHGRSMRATSTFRQGVDGKYDPAAPPKSDFEELSNRFGASGDFAEAYVVAYEVGHHVQNQLGILPKFNEARQRMSEADANKMSVRVELQADCFAGIWGKYTFTVSAAVGGRQCLDTTSTYAT